MMQKLSVERWRQIDTLFAEVLDRPPDERTAFLRFACGDDLALYRQIVELLDSVDAAEEALGESATVYAAPVLPGLQADFERGRNEAPRRVGPYRLLEEIGRGGMGSVYLAERADGQFEHTVALKLVRRGMDTDEILRRFRNERQILASLQHPNIARLLDGGVAEDGRPFLVMEYVDGVPIDRYCDDRRCSVDDRLALFMTVCEAVEYAHRNLVVHRDLKPSNILVDAEGRVKLLDFGIAKLLADEEEPGDAMITRTGARVMTPAYAAPEQITGAAVTTATDAYALGLLLYELLTGCRAYSVSDLPPAEAEQVVLRAVPERPSTVAGRCEEEVGALRSTTTRRLRRRLRGDLDTILLKAVRKEPERRYPSAERLLDDLRRSRAGLPVRARPDTFGYRARRFVRRHRYGVAAAAAFAVLLTSFAVAMALQQAATVRERDLARQERDKAEEVAAFLESLLAAADPFEPERRDTLRVQDLLSRGVARIEADLADRPAVQAQMLNTVGRVYDQLGRYDEAEALLGDALATRSRLLGPAHPDVAESLAELGWTYYNMGRYEEADTLLGRALAIQRGLAEPASGDLGETLRSHGMVLERLGRFDEAEPKLREALERYRQEHGDAHIEVATSLSALATVLWSRGEHDEAEALYRESLALRRTLYGDGHPGLAVGLHNLATLLRDLQRYDEAEALLREAAAINRAALGAEHPRVVDNLNVLASVLRGKGDYEAAEPVFAEVLDLRRRIHGPDHPSVSITLDSYAALRKAQGDLDGAERMEREAIAIARTVYGDDHFAVALTTSKLAGIVRAKGELAEATRLYRWSADRMEVLLGADHLHTSLTRLNLGTCLAESGRYEEAEALLLASHAALVESQGPESGFARRAADGLIYLYEAWGRPDEAAPFRTASAEDDGA